MNAPTEVVLSWIADESFQILSPERAGRTLDGNRREGLSPMESLLVSLAGCMGIDVVMILAKMRSGLSGLVVRALGERQENPPRYFQRIELEFRIQGPVTESQADRAVDLSIAKYCSVLHSLRPDLEVQRRIVLE